MCLDKIPLILLSPTNQRCIVIGTFEPPLISHGGVRY